MPPATRRHLIYVARQGRWGRFERPRTFSEKINWRLLNDRRDVLVDCVDKAAAKERARRIVPSLIVADTVWFAETPNDLPPTDLSCSSWVGKPNHRSGIVHFGSGPIMDLFTHDGVGEWFEEDRARVFGEWAYSRARPGVMVESRLSRSDNYLDDYKFFVFAGRVELVQVDRDRFTDHRRQLLDREWRPLDATLHFPRPDRPTAAPARAEEMIRAAEALGADMDFIRVDLYELDDGVGFGELTPYPGGGTERFRPRRLDEQLGACWRLPVGHG